MELSPRRLADTLVLRPAGRIDHANADAFQTRLMPVLAQCAAGKDRLVFDFSDVDYISSAGLRVLMLAAKQAKAQGGIIVITGLRPLVAEIFDISRFTMVFTIKPSLREALAEVSTEALAAYESA
jgi:anti-anti-sigma factor